MTAARHCLEGDFNGFTGWYLPTKQEMELIYSNREILDKAINKRHNFDKGIKREKYWCSNLYLIENNKKAWSFDMVTGKDPLEPKESALCVRPVRRF